MVNTRDVPHFLLPSFSRLLTNHMSVTFTRHLWSLSNYSLSTKPVFCEKELPFFPLLVLLAFSEKFNWATNLEKTLKREGIVETEISNEDDCIAVDPFKIITSQALVCFFSFLSRYLFSFYIIYTVTLGFECGM